MRLRDERGFTLIEIIAVLIILGILAAVAIPKYLGMAEDAELAAAKGVVAELNGRLSIAYAKQLIALGYADGSKASDYNSFDGKVTGWSSTNSTPGAAIQGLKRDGGTRTYTATWQTGDENSPGYWNEVNTSAGS